MPPANFFRAVNNREIRRDRVTSTPSHAKAACAGDPERTPVIARDSENPAT